MIFSIHYFLITSGLCAMGVLLGVFFTEYSDARQLEIGGLFLIMPLTAMFIRPLLCSLADRQMAHKRYLIYYMWIYALGYLPFVIIPFLGPAAHVDHPRICWYTLVVFKIIGDVGLGAVLPLGDALAINYAQRIGADYCTYRKWGTLSWGIFGIIIGQINEVWFLPKYVGGFLVLVTSAFLDILIIWLWPDEFFKMVPKKNNDINDETGKVEVLVNKTLEEKDKSSKVEKEKSKIKIKKEKAKDLMNWSQVFLRMRAKLLNRCAAEKKESDVKVAVSSPQSNIKNEKQEKPSDKSLSKRHQMTILSSLFVCDLRIVSYLLILTLSGMAASFMSFLFIYISQVCALKGVNFSQLAGYLQSVAALLETLFFMYASDIKNLIGRLNLLALAFLIQTCRFLFYGYLFDSVSPHYSILSEALQGVAFGSYVVVMADVAHEFAHETRHLLPHLSSANGKNFDINAIGVERALLALASTMQALFSSSFDGVGRALGALMCGLISDSLSFTVLWRVCGYSSMLICALLLLINILFSTCIHYEPSFASKARSNEKAEKKTNAH